MKFFYFLINHLNISSKTRHIIYPCPLNSNYYQFFKNKFFKKSYLNNKKLIKTNFSKNCKFKKKNYFFILAFQTFRYSFWKKSFFWFSNNNLKKYFVLLFTSQGSYLLEPLVYGLYYKVPVLSIYFYYVYNIEKPLGISNFFFFFEENFFFFFVIFKKKLYGSSNGTFCIVNYFDSILEMYLLKLPSKKKIFLPLKAYGHVGRNSNIFWKKKCRGGYFTKYFSHFTKLQVRGVAKNPVDHPNGGRTNVKSPFKTPWGLIAKKSK